MTLTEKMRKAGIVGCGGAGFPSYAKLNKSADTIILNCAECEPLLKLHRQVMEKKSFEIMTALEEVAEALEVNRVIIAIKGSYVKAVDSIKAQISSFRHIEIGILPEAYPVGDEVVAIYETTGRVVPPGSIPIAVGVIVYNVETMLNTYYAIKEDKPVTTKFVTITGEVKNPMTVEVPLGITFDDLVELAGGVTIKDYTLISGGPMMGNIVAGNTVVTKTTSAVIVLPNNSYVVEHHRPNVQLQFNRARAVCCDCRMCTDLCPRNLLGHPIDPARFMTAGVSNVTNYTTPFINTLYCCSCGVCEMYACTQGLSPRTLIGVYKGGLRKHGVARADVVESKPVNPRRSHRLVSKERLTSRLGLDKYDVECPLTPVNKKFKSFKLNLGQHIGVPCEPKVSVGDKVTKDMLIAMSPDKTLGVALNSPVDGVVANITDKFIEIRV